MCDLARDIRLLTCRHCGKTARIVAHLILHLQVHGVKRFLCGLCPYRAFKAGWVRNHMKKVHSRADVVDQVSVQGSGPANGENKLHTFIPRKIVSKTRKRF